MRLLERTTRRLAPTEAGRGFAEQARRLLADYDASVRAAANPEAPLHGLLRITAPTVFGRRHVTPVVTSFLDAWPSVRAVLLLSDRNLDLVDEGLDVAVRIGRLADSGMVARRVGEVRRLLVASSVYLKKCGIPKQPEDLANHTIIFTSGRSGQLAWRFRVNGRERTFRLEPRLIVNDVDAALLTAQAGLGLASALSYQVVDHLASGKLIRLLADFEVTPLPVQLVVPSARHLAPRVRVFLDHAAQHLGALPVVHGLP